MMSFYNDEGMFPLVLLIIIIWTLFWKVYAIWIAVKNNDKKWFIALIVFNTVGILEIIYIFYVAKKKWVDVKKAVNRLFK